MSNALPQSYKYCKPEFRGPLQALTGNAGDGIYQVVGMRTCVCGVAEKNDPGWVHKANCPCFPLKLPGIKLLHRRGSELLQDMETEKDAYLPQSWFAPVEEGVSVFIHNSFVTVVETETKQAVAGRRFVINCVMEGYVTLTFEDGTPLQAFGMPYRCSSAWLNVA